MKKKSKKDESDFFSHAKKRLGKKAFGRAVKKGQEKVHELRLKMAREMIGLNQTDLKGLTQPEVSKIENISRNITVRLRTASPSSRTPVSFQ